MINYASGRQQETNESRMERSKRATHLKWSQIAHQLQRARTMME